MPAKSPATLASSAAEAIRSLNHATLNYGRVDWEYPSDAYDVIGGLDRMAGMLPQALDQVDALLSTVAGDKRLRSDRGTPDQDIVQALAALADARDAAVQLNAALSRAHSATGALGWEG